MTTRLMISIVFAAVLALASGVARAQVCATCPSFAKSTSPAVKQLAELVGCWRGKGPNGLGAKVSYELGSDKTALLETMWIENNPTMYTMYYLDGQVPMAHHFCSYGNQLRMRAEPGGAGKLDFLLIDSTNLPSRHENHVYYAKFTFEDRDHFAVEWGLHHDGRNLRQPYVFRRVARGCTARPDDW